MDLERNVIGRLDLSAHDMTKRWALENMVMKLQVP